MNKFSKIQKHKRTKKIKIMDGGASAPKNKQTKVNLPTSAIVATPKLDRTQTNTETRLSKSAVKKLGRLYTTANGTKYLQTKKNGTNATHMDLKFTIRLNPYTGKEEYYAVHNQKSQLTPISKMILEQMIHNNTKNKITKNLGTIGTTLRAIPYVGVVGGIKNAVKRGGIESSGNERSTVKKIGNSIKSGAQVFSSGYGIVSRPLEALARRIKTNKPIAITTVNAAAAEEHPAVLRAKAYKAYKAARDEAFGNTISPNSVAQMEFELGQQ